MLLACALAGCLLSASASVAEETEVEKLRAELKALKDENAKLKALSKDFMDLVQTLNAIHDEEAKLDGVWVIESATRDGKDVKSDKGGEVEFRGNRLVARMPGNKNPIRRELGLQPSLRHMYFLDLPGKNAAIPTSTSFDLCYGLYELDGDTLRVSLLSAYGIPKTISDKGQVLWVLKRKQP